MGQVQTWRDGLLWWAAASGVDAIGATEQMALRRLREKLRSVG